jgi:hypothetical protein
MEDEDDRLLAAGALLGKKRFETFAAVLAKRLEGVSECNAPVDAHDNPTPLEARAPPERGLDYPRQTIGLAKRP